MANVTASMENVAKTTLWQSNESSYLNCICRVHVKGRTGILPMMMSKVNNLNGDS